MLYSVYRETSNQLSCRICNSYHACVHCRWRMKWWRTSTHPGKNSTRPQCTTSHRSTCCSTRRRSLCWSRCWDTCRRRWSYMNYNPRYPFITTADNTTVLLLFILVCLSSDQFFQTGIRESDAAVGGVSHRHRNQRAEVSFNQCWCCSKTALLTDLKICIRWKYYKKIKFRNVACEVLK